MELYSRQTVRQFGVTLTALCAFRAVVALHAWGTWRAAPADAAMPVWRTSAMLPCALVHAAFACCASIACRRTRFRLWPWLMLAVGCWPIMALEVVAVQLHRAPPLLLAAMGVSYFATFLLAVLTALAVYGARATYASPHGAACSPSRRHAGALQRDARGAREVDAGAAAVRRPLCHPRAEQRAAAAVGVPQPLCTAGDGGIHCGHERWARQAQARLACPVIRAPAQWCRSVEKRNVHTTSLL